MPGPVHYLAQSGIWLAIGSGNIIQLIKQGTIDLYKTQLSWLLANLEMILTNSYLGKSHPLSKPT